MRRCASILLFIAIACPKHEAPPPAAPAIETPITDAAERTSLCDIAHGATTVSRTGEAFLGASALHAIDGDPGTFWMTPLADLPQSTVIALPARSRVDRVGIRTVVKGGFSANRVSFEGSNDGKTFSPIVTIKSASTNEAQWFDIKPAELSYMRVTMIDGAVANHDVRLYSILAAGKELEPARAGDITGCWNINGEPARFERHGSYVTGILQTGKEPMRFDGGFDGRIYRLSWIRGNDYGMALITISPDGQRLSGLNWHEEAIPMFFDTSWFGERAKCNIDIGQPAAAILERTERLSLYGRTELPITPSAQFHFVAHEFRFPTAKENQGDVCIAAGSDSPRQDPVTESMRALYSTVDLEIRR
ncbi:MAG: hypothetical protein DMF59_06845 [Acidobacteria bacterium]|nr:MAG: hypothetical protein DMF59_06845 [Acidobacteriota bacterium]